MRPLSVMQWSVLDVVYSKIVKNQIQAIDLTADRSISFIWFYVCYGLIATQFERIKIGSLQQKCKILFVNS